jgi:hypothetical protein
MRGYLKKIANPVNGNSRFEPLIFLPMEKLKKNFRQFKKENFEIVLVEY